MSTDLSFKKPEKNTVSIIIFKSFMLLFGTAVLFFVSQVVGVVFLYSALSLFGYDSTEIENLLTGNAGLQFLAVLLIALVTIGLLWILHKFRNLNFLKSVLLNRRPSTSDIGISLLIYVIYFITLITVVGIVSWLIPAIDIDQAQQIGFENTKGLSLIFVFLTLVVIPPIMEEIVFRGFLFKRLKGLIKYWPAAIITSVIFALAHTEFLGDNPLNWIAAIDTFVFSFYLIYLLEKTGSLWAPIILHAIKNCIAFVVLFII
jgi:membrane protease YdiL (CAAX protease family)